MTAARTYYVGLQLLDRQLVDRHGRMVGKIDDLQLDGDAGRPLYIDAILSGPGVLAERLGRRYGAWVQRVHRVVAQGTPRGQGEDPARIPFWRVVEIGSSVELAAEEEELGTHSTEKWVADHVMRHIPGARHAPE